MDKLGTFLKFTLKVLVAVLVINIVANALNLTSLLFNPLGDLRSRFASGNGG